VDTESMRFQPLPVELIKKTQSKKILSKSEIDFLINGYAQGEIPDYQISAWLMAVWLNGLTDQESAFLTEAMLNSGDTADLSEINNYKIDKHSTGGVGDKTSLILAPIVASLGVTVPMISGRGLGHTGGTLDKLESIPGFNTQLSLQQFSENLKKLKLCFIGQTKEICPADKKIYALRDVTGTIDSLPLICASIMSKKIAEGIDGLVLDIKFGSGAFMKTKEQSLQLAERLAAIAKLYKKDVCCFLTSMNQPLGKFAGNALEINECLEILKNKTEDYSDTYNLSLNLAAKMLHLAKYKSTMAECLEAATDSVRTGKAYEKFCQVAKAQGGDLTKIPMAKNKTEVFVEKPGFIKSFDVEAIGMTCVLLKAGRKNLSDVIDPTAGIEFHYKIGEAVDKSKPLFTIYGSESNLFEAAKSRLQNCVKVSESTVTPEELIWKVF
jgi:pyrimidine-nucleoside phosphorylase